MTGDEDVAHMAWNKNCAISNPEGKTPLRRSRNKRQDNRTDLTDKWC